jgi:transcription elongation factor Elf1
MGCLVVSKFQQIDRNPVLAQKRNFVRIDRCKHFSKCSLEMAKVNKSGMFTCQYCEIFKQLVISAMTGTDLTKCDCYSLIIKYVSTIQRLKDRIAELEDGCFVWIK